jgi:hypothetical protein
MGFSPAPPILTNQPTASDQFGRSAVVAMWAFYNSDSCKRLAPDYQWPALSAAGSADQWQLRWEGLAAGQFGPSFSALRADLTRPVSKEAQVGALARLYGLCHRHRDLHVTHPSRALGKSRYDVDWEAANLGCAYFT